jgi:allantoin racemase
MIRICAVAIVSAAEQRDPAKLARLNYFMRNYELAKAPDTSIAFMSAAEGLMNARAPWSAASNAYACAMNAPGIIGTVIEAERQGFDAAIIHCGHDPALLEARQAVDIPVVGLLESAVTMATLVAGRYGVILIDEEARWPVREAIHRYGLSEKLVSMRAFPSSTESQQKGVAKEKHEDLEDFIAVSRALIADGADAIVVACSAHSPMARLATAEMGYPNGLTEVDGVPVIDMLSSGVKMAEMMVSLKRAGSAWISRKGLYHRPSGAVQDMLQTDFPAPAKGFWHT